MFRQFFSFIMKHKPQAIIAALITILTTVVSSYIYDHYFKTSPEEEQIKQLIATAKGMNPSPENCKTICNQSIGQNEIFFLLPQCTPEQRQNMDIYIQCFKHKQDSDVKFISFDVWKKNFDKKQSYGMYESIYKELPELNSYDEAFQPNKYKESIKAKDFVASKLETGKAIIDTFANKAEQMCNAATEKDCQKISEEYKKYSTAMDHNFDDNVPDIYLNKTLKDCLRKCRIY